jgi:hypothetical protein
MIQFGKVIFNISQFSSRLYTIKSCKLQGFEMITNSVSLYGIPMTGSTNVITKRDRIALYHFGVEPPILLYIIEIWM